MWDRERVIGTWQRRTGRSASGVELHEAAQMAKITGILAVGGHLYRQGLSTDERMSTWSNAPDRMIPYIRERIDRGRDRRAAGSSPSINQ
jgi:hypothetical protein